MRTHRAPRRSRFTRHALSERPSKPSCSSKIVRPGCTTPKKAPVAARADRRRHPGGADGSRRGAGDRGALRRARGARGDGAAEPAPGFDARRRAADLTSLCPSGEGEERARPGSDFIPPSLIAHQTYAERVFPVALGAPGRLALMPRPRGDDRLDDELRALRADSVDIIVSLLERTELSELGLGREADACASTGLEFRSFPIADRDVPPMDATTRAFIDGVRDALAAGAFVVVNCRVGIGRSSLIAAAVMQRLGVQVHGVMSVRRAVPVLLWSLSWPSGWSSARPVTRPCSGRSPLDAHPDEQVPPGQTLGRPDVGPKSSRLVSCAPSASRRDAGRISRGARPSSCDLP